MLERTFIHLDGVGPWTERSFWAAGVETWADVLEGRCPESARRFRPQIEESARRLDAADAVFFHGSLPPSERWRLYADFLPSAAFVDIETTGLTPDYHVITMVGVLDREGFTAYVRGEGLDDLPAALRRYRLVVTFNGARFDLPFLRAEFGRSGQGDLLDHAAHVDLMHVLRRIGFRGGLKAIERRLGVGRAAELGDLDGFDAVRLWRMAQEGEPGAVATLIRYNAEDVASLPRLGAQAVRALARGTPLERAAVWPFPELDTSPLPYDRSLVEYLRERKAYRPFAPR
ncbi:MAG: ribonuclease H-like domain-containing protein [Gemmatimonadetes bacterium]|nr:ribonuclease H-like domain-containing protein [Gemmatimonadota bacterium]